MSFHHLLETIRAFGNVDALRVELTPFFQTPGTDNVSHILILVLLLNK